MTTEYYTLVSASSALGILRWIVAILLVALVIFFLIRQIKTKKSLSFIITFVACLVFVPFLLLSQVSVKVDPGTPEPTPVDPVPHVEPEPEPIPEPEPDDIEPITPSNTDPKKNTKPVTPSEPNAPDTPDTPDEPDTPDTPDEPDEPDEPDTPDEPDEPDTPDEPDEPDEPDTPDEPDEPEVPATYSVIHRQQNLEDDEYTTIESETKTGIAGKEATPATKTYTGFIAPSAVTVTVAEDNSTEVVYDYNREIIDLTVDDSDLYTASLLNDGYKYGTEVTLTAKDRTGYVFSGWSNGATTNSVTVTLGADEIPQPIYNANTYRIIFNKNSSNATGSMSAQELKYDQPENLSTNGFALLGYSFDHWNTKDDDSGESYTDGQSVKNLATEGDVDLYAFWAPNTNTPYTVKHYKQNIGGGDNYTLADTDNKTGTTDAIATPSRKSYTGFKTPAVQSKTITGDGQMVVEYYYTRNQYTITFSENAALISSDTFESGQKYYFEQTGTLTAGSKTGYTFESWTDSATDATRSFVMGASDVTIGANYRANTYSVIFHANYPNSSATTSQSFTYNQEAALNDNNFERVGYNFDHWNTAAGNTGDDYANKVSVQNLTDVDGGEFHLYAQWTPRNDTAYIVRPYIMNTNGTGYVPLSDINLTGTSDTEVTPQPEERFGFDTPEPKTALIKADGSTVIEYYYVRQKRHLTLQDPEYIETTTPTGDYYFNSTIKLTAIAREGYRFVKWSNNRTENPLSFSIEYDETIRPIYEANTYNIIFHKNDGADPETTSSQSRTYDDILPFALTKNTFAREGYRFLGWASSPTATTAEYVDEASIDTDLSTSADVDLYAVWQRQYTVQFDVNGGESSKPANIIVDAGQTISSIPADATWTDYTFDGWWSGNTKLESSTVINQDTTFSAHWIKNIDNSDVTITPASISVTRGESSTIAITTGSDTWPLESYLISGYDSEIISIDSNLVVSTIKAGETEITITGSTSGKTVTIPVEVLLPKYTVSFVTNSETEIAPITNVVEGSTITIPTPTKTKNIFEYWATADDEKLEVDTQIMGDVTYYAHWTPDVTNAVVDDLSIERTKTGQIVVSNKDEIESFSYSTENATIATVSDSGLVTANTTGATRILLTGAKSHEIYYVNITVTPLKYTITFDAQNETTTTTRDVAENTAIGTLPEVSYEGHTFDGWFTENGTEPIDATYVVTSSETIYAHWTEDEPEPVYVCKEAVELHTATCGRGNNDTKGCKSVKSTDTILGGTIEGTTITYGNLATSRSPKSGDAYDCDITGQGDYKRFYVISKDNEKVRLIYHTNYEVDHDDIAHSVVYEAALNNLPTETQWTNPHFMEYDDGKITRFPMYEDIATACGNDSSIINEKPLSCLYLLENTTFERAKVSDSVGPRSGIWIYKHNERLYRIQAESVAFGDVTNPSTGPSKNSARPVIQVPLEYIEPATPAPKHTITFDSQGGSPIDPIEISEDTPIASLPTPEKELFDFGGWYKDTDWEEKVEAGDYVTEDLLLVAKWVEADVVAKVENDPTYYDSLQLAVSNVPTTGVKTKVTLYRNVQENISISNSQNVELDLRDNTLTCATGNSIKNAIQNNGQLEITSGTITCGTSTIPTIENTANGNLTISGGQITTSTSNVISNYGSLTITGGIIHTSTAQGAVNNESGATFLMTGGQINANGENNGGRQALYNNGGTATIDGNAVITSKTNARATVHNLNNGTVNIVGGTITSTNGYAVFNGSGTLNIGVENNRIDTTTPLISGKTYGAIGKDSYNFYDGTIKGETYPIGNVTKMSGTNPSTIVSDNSEPPVKISDIEDGATYVHGVDGSYKTLTLALATTDYRIDFDANGGTAPTPSYITVTPSEAIGDNFPTTSRASYDFLGWFTDPDDGEGEEVNAATIPDGDTTYYAHWQHDDTIVEFNIQSEAMQNYFANIDTWSAYNKNDFLLAMKGNFDGHQCKNYTNTSDSDISTDTTIFPDEYRYDNSGTIECDKPVAYDTNINGAIKVYLSDENRTKGAEANYLNTDNGLISNMIPGTIYMWESESDPEEYGFVKATGAQRVITLSSARNVRDLGGLTGTYGTIKYGKLLRGEKLGGNDVQDLTKLGINQEYDLRGGNDSTPSMSNYKNIKTINYDIDPTDAAGSSNYDLTRAALVSLMQDIVNGKNIYFHCTHGADRTGTIAYLAEGLLGIDYETRAREYELTSLSGRADRTRFYEKKSNNTSGDFNGTRKFIYMTGFIKTNQQIESWFKAKLTTQEEIDAADLLIEQFRAAMIEGYGQ